eukprot:12960957-Alexandrium_andersonii.AAC.1
MAMGAPQVRAVLASLKHEGQEEVPSLPSGAVVASRVLVPDRRPEWGDPCHARASGQVRVRPEHVALMGLMLKRV